MFVCSVVCICVCVYYLFFFFFKQKTAYEMRISDWSSDVCSSDLLTVLHHEIDVVEIVGAGDAVTRDDKAEWYAAGGGALDHGSLALLLGRVDVVDAFVRESAGVFGVSGDRQDNESGSGKNGRASCRDRVCQYV